MLGAPIFTATQWSIDTTLEELILYVGESSLIGHDVKQAMPFDRRPAQLLSGKQVIDKLVLVRARKRSPLHGGDKFRTVVVGRRS